MGLSNRELCFTLAAMFLMGALASWGLFGPLELLKHLTSGVFVALATLATAFTAIVLSLLGRHWQLLDKASDERNELVLAGLRTVDQLRTWRAKIFEDLEYLHYAALGKPLHERLKWLANGSFKSIPYGVDDYLCLLVKDPVVAAPIIRVVRTAKAFSHFSEDPGPGEVGFDGSTISPERLIKMAEQAPQDLRLVIERIEKIIK